MEDEIEAEEGTDEDSSEMADHLLREMRTAPMR
jgi:hypothetical protein